MADQEHNIEQIFREALQAHESSVGSEVWAGVQSGLTGAAASSAGVAATGSAFLGKAAAVIGAAGLITLATVSEVQYHQEESVPVAVTVEQETQNDQPLEQTFVIKENADIKGPEAVQLASDENSSATSNQIDQFEEKPEQAMAPIKEDGLEDESNDEPINDGGDEDAALAATETPNDGKATGDQKDQAIEQEMEASQNEPEREIAEREVSVVSQEEEHEEEAPVSMVVLETPSVSTIIKPMNVGLNDCFSLKCEQAAEFQIIIYERVSGQRVFESKDPNFKWCGDDPESSRQRPGLYQYFYEVMAVDANGVPAQARSSFRVAR